MKRTLLFLMLAILPQLGFAANGIRLNTQEPPTPTTGFENGHEWVDLGLPSGTLWATCNVGASSPEEYGDYFAWGETRSKTEYTWETLKYCNDKKSNKYVPSNEYLSWSGEGDPDNKWLLDPCDDAASVNWGGQWRIPSVNEWLELNDNCTWEWVGGAYKLIGPNGQSIILPAAGYRKQSDLQSEGYSGFYFANRIRTYSLPWRMGFSSAGHSVNSGSLRYWGISVRPVTVRSYKTDCDSRPESEASDVYNGREWVDLGLPSGTKWATCNIGASNPTESGDYYAWGETSTKSEYTWENYRFWTGGDNDDNIQLSKYNTDISRGPADYRTILEPSDDAARAIWGGEWRIPTKEQWKELCDYCSVEWNYGNATIRLSSPNGQSIVLPATHHQNEGFGFFWCYWSSDLFNGNPINAWVYYCIEEGDAVTTNRRYFACPIRPVTQ